MIPANQKYLTPIVELKPWDPLEVSRIARDKCPPMFECRIGNDQVSVTVGVPTFPADNPEIGCSIQDFACDRKNLHTLAQGIKGLQFSRGLFESQPSYNFIMRKRRNCELAIRLEVGISTPSDDRVLALEKLRQDIRIK